MKQRITAMLLALALCGSLAACGNAEDTGRAEQQEENQTVDTMKPDAHGCAADRGSAGKAAGCARWRFLWRRKQYV